MEEVLTAALHALNVAFSMVDMQAEDQPMVWLSRGFERMTGLSRNEASGRNCRYLQTDGTDPAAIAQMKSAITAGEPTRVYIWNRGPSLDHGFWNLIALYPGYDEGAQGQEGTGELRYYAAVCVSLSSHRLKKITRLAPQLVGHNSFATHLGAPSQPPPPPSPWLGSAAAAASASISSATAACTAGAATSGAATNAATTKASDDALGAVLRTWRKAFEKTHARPPTRDEMRSAIDASIDASLGPAEGAPGHSAGGWSTGCSSYANSSYANSPAAGAGTGVPATSQPWVVDLSALRGPRNSF